MPSWTWTIFRRRICPIKLDFAFGLSLPIRYPLAVGRLNLRKMVYTIKYFNKKKGKNVNFLIIIVVMVHKLSSTVCSVQWVHWAQCTVCTNLYTLQYSSLLFYGYKRQCFLPFLFTWSPLGKIKCPSTPTCCNFRHDSSGRILDFRLFAKSFDMSWSSNDLDTKYFFI